MGKTITIAVFGASGKVGSHFVNQALDAGYKIKAFVRTPSKYEHSHNPHVELVTGDVTNYQDVEDAIAHADVVVSCLGNVNKKVLIMHSAHDNILAAAAQQSKVPRCILISTIGCGRTSWIIKQMLMFIVGRAGYADYEKADKRVREETSVPFLLIRPYVLTDKAGTGTYHVTKKRNGTFLRTIPRADVARFMLDMVSDSQWDGSPGVLLGGEKAQ